MTVLTSFAELTSLPQPIVLAIGVFDGVHLGHQSVISATIERARSVGGTAVVMTFDPHPLRVLRPEVAPRLLCSTMHLCALLERIGVEHLLLYPFDKSVAATEAEAFVRQLAAGCGRLESIFVGETWRFGKGRAGDVAMLTRLGAELGFSALGVTPFMLGDDVVSSTLVRAAVDHGDLDRAQSLLGRDYSVLGKVIAGRKLARQLGWPTANVEVQGTLLPPNGVYVVEAFVHGHWQRAVANLGYRPTVAAEGEALALEVHVLDFNSDLYGQPLEVRFLRKLRDEKKFASLDELRSQIAADVEETRMSKSE